MLFECSTYMCVCVWKREWKADESKNSDDSLPLLAINDELHNKCWEVVGFATSFFPVLNINGTCSFRRIVHPPGYHSANHRRTCCHGSNITDSFHLQWNPHSTLLNGSIKMNHINSPQTVLGICCQLLYVSSPHLRFLKRICFFPELFRADGLEN